MNADLYNLKNERAGTMELPERVFGVKWNPDLVHQALRVQLNGRRNQSAHAKGRSEVSGGGKKHWRQKGTGRARHGSIRSPIWKGGGVTHGPTKERDYTLKINKKMKQLAIFSVLARRFKDGEIKIVDSLTIKEPKTKILNDSLKGFIQEKKVTLNALIIPAEGDKNIYKATRNLVKVGATSAKSLNIYDLLHHKQILMDKSAVSVINEHYNEI
ncbi:MAG: 50S ribosomal protein L4 [Patescibacteria group bacterium]